jgi:tryptophan synthase beta chain
MNNVKITLEPDEMPKQWYNVNADLPEPVPPPLHPGTGKPVGPADLAPLFPMELIRQEVTGERFVPIPEEVQEMYLRIGRPTPLYRATRLERHLKTPAKIFFKREDLSFSGSHKTNTSIAQAYFNMKEGVERLATETGAGQWGSALSLAGAFFGIGVNVYMVRASYNQKPYRKTLMNMYGAEVSPSPSDKTEFGRKMLAKDPNHPGSLGIAISEAIETAVKSGGSVKYSLGSVLNHVLLHQTIIGQETLLQLEKAGEKPDVMLGCFGGGSNFGGFALPAIGRTLRKEQEGVRFVAVEPEACPKLSKGEYRYDFGDTAGMTPKLMMYTLGHDFIPSPIHAGGLRYHGGAPVLCKLKKLGVTESVFYDQLATFEAGALFARTEGIVPAPESSHAIRGAIDEALMCKESGEVKTIVFNLSGHGLLDLKGYEDFMDGKLSNGTNGTPYKSAAN